MKKFIITLLAFCFVQFSFGQSIKSIRVNNAVQGHSWSYAISEIDSITFDPFSQLQKIHINGDCKESILEDVDSVSFSTDEAVNVVLSKEYIEDAESYIFSNGIILVEIEDSVQGKIIIVDSLDVTQSQWSGDKSFMIYCDSTYKPLIAKDSQFIFYFEYNENGNLIEINATDLDGNIVSPINANARRNAIRRISTEGWTTGDDIGAALDLYGTAKKFYDPESTAIDFVGIAVSWLDKLLPEGIPRDILELTPDIIDILKKKKPGLLESLLKVKKLIQHYGELRARRLIGDCTPYIKSAYKEGKNSAIINVQIAGVTSTSQDTPYYVIKYWQEVNGSSTNATYYTSPQKATNGTHPITINNLNGGRYGFQVLIFPSLCLGHDNKINLYNFRSNIAYVDIARLHFKVLAQGYTTYADDYVTVSMKAILDFPSEQDKTILSYYDSYGVYVHYNNHVNQREDYYSVKENGSLEFYINLDIPRDEFSCDYSNFVATCADKITFKTYTIEGWGIKEFYDEQEPKIVYDEKPSITVKSVWSTGTEPYMEENEQGWDTHGHYTYTIEISGSFFIDKLYRSSFGTSWYTQFANEIPFSGHDETIEYVDEIIYKSGENYPSTYYGVYGTTQNGNTILPNNYVQFLGDMNFIIVNSIGSSSNAKSRQKYVQDYPLPILPMNIPITDK